MPGFYPSHDNSVHDLNQTADKFMCLEKDHDVEIQGDYHSPAARLLKLTFEKCDNSASEIACQGDQ